MIAYIIEHVRQVRGIDRVIVTTEDVEIASVAKQYGAEVPFMRPMELATDEVATLPVLQHAVQWLEQAENYKPDFVLLVYPTSPLLSSARIQEAVDLAFQYDADSVVSGTRDRSHYWQEVEGGYQRLYPLKLENRQATKALFKENGAIYLTKRAVLKRQIVADKMIPLLMSDDETIDVDEQNDFDRVAEILSARGL